MVPLVVLIFTYTSICMEIWQSSESSLRPRSSQKSAPGKRTPLISRAKINTVKQTIAVIVMYIACSSPFILAQLWVTWDPESPFIEGKHRLRHTRSKLETCVCSVKTEFVVAIRWLERLGRYYPLQISLFCLCYSFELVQKKISVYRRILHLYYSCTQVDLAPIQLLVLFVY